MATPKRKNDRVRPSHSIQAAKPKRQTNTETLPAQMSLEASATIEFEAAAGEGVAPLAKFKMVANNGNPMRLAGWRYPVVVDFAGLNIPSQSRPTRMNHDADQGVGHTDSISVKGGQLVASGIVSRDTAAARDVVASGKNGFPWQASVGMSADEVEFIKEGEAVTVNGKQFSGPLNVARKSTLGEISFVDLGADDKTTVKVAAGKKPEPTDDEEVEELGDEEAAMEAALAEERSQRARRGAIGAIVKKMIAMPGVSVDWIQKKAQEAIKGNMSSRDFELGILREERPRFAIHISENKIEPKALEAALCLSGGCAEKSVEKWYGGDTLQAARTAHGGVSLSEVFHQVINAAGMHARPGRMTDSTIRTAFEADRTIRASGDGFSTISLSGILSNVANKTLLEAYQAVPVIAPVVCAQTDANDFKQISRYRMTGVGLLEKLGPDGEIKSATLTDETYNNQVATYAKGLKLTRQMIINDDLGAFLQIPRIMGRQSALALEDAFFTLLLANTGTFFGAGNKNYISGAATNLQISSLTTAEQTFLDQTDSDGKPVLITPAFLLVPSSLKVVAQQLMTETRVIATGIGSSEKIVPANNPHAGKWQPLASPYLNNSAYTGYSTTAWYLIANPLDVAFMEIAYLRGARTPVIESGEADFDVLGMGWRAYFDFGVNFQDKRGAVQSKGAA